MLPGGRSLQRLGCLPIPICPALPHSCCPACPRSIHLAQIFDSRAAFRRLANELEEIFKAQDFNMVGFNRLPRHQVTEEAQIATSSCMLLLPQFPGKAVQMPAPEWSLYTSILPCCRWWRRRMSRTVCTAGTSRWAALTRSRPWARSVRSKLCALC